MKIKRLNNRGDTILEVLICIAVLALIVAAAYTLTSRNQLTAQQSQERSTALKIADTQLELLRAYGSSQSLESLKNDYFCIPTGAPDTTVKISPAPQANVAADGPTVYPSACQAGPDNRYKIAIWGYARSSAVNADNSGKSVFAVTVRWDSIKGGSREEVKIFYVTYDATGTSTPPPSLPGPSGPVSHIGAVLTVVAPGASTVVHWDTGPTATSCTGFQGAATFDPRPLLLGIFSTGPLSIGSHTYTIQCRNGFGTAGNTTSVTINVPPPLPSVTISPSQFDFPAWHLAETDTSKYRNHIFTVNNPLTSPSDFHISTTPLSGASASSYQLTGGGNNCAGKTLRPGEGCDIEVKFAPPTGGLNNHYANAGFKPATVTVNNSEGVSMSAPITGWTVSDRLASGESMVTQADDNQNAMRALRGYSSSCSNSAFSCSSGLFMWTSTLALYPNVTVNLASMIIPTAASTAMQTDGNVVVRNGGGGVLWNTGPNGVSGTWLWLRSDGALFRMYPNYDTSNSVHSYIAP